MTKQELPFDKRMVHKDARPIDPATLTVTNYIQVQLLYVTFEPECAVIYFMFETNL